MIHFEPPVYKSRIPDALRNVLKEPNQGVEVHTPPPKRVASKVFGSRETMDSWPVVLVASTLADDEKLTHPQGHLDFVLRTRGYSTKRYETAKSAYYNKPTALQQASHDAFMTYLIRSRNTESFREIMASGLSPNPCTRSGESLVHMLCRKGDSELLQILVDNGCSLQVADDFGRTPLHDACWAAEPAFDVIQTILERDVRLFHMMDCRGHLPLNYVPEEHWEKCIQFIETIKDIYWPQRTEAQYAPFLAQLGANTRSIPDPVNALTPELARMVASGRMKPDEALFLRSDCEDATEQDMPEDGSLSCSYDSDDENCEDILAEMSGLLQSLPLPRVRNV